MLAVWWRTLSSAGVEPDIKTCNRPSNALYFQGLDEAQEACYDDFRQSEVSQILASALCTSFEY